MKHQSEALSKSKVKELIRLQVNEHWSIIQAKLKFKSKSDAYGFFIGMATRESTLNAGLETGQDSSHAFGALQTAETAYANANPNYIPENDVPEMKQYKFTNENFYDPKISIHMGIRKLIHFSNQAGKIYTGNDLLIRSLIGFNTGWLDKADENWIKEYAHEIGALSGWYIYNNHLYDNNFTWTKDEKVSRTNPWNWY